MMDWRVWVVILWVGSALSAGFTGYNFGKHNVQVAFDDYKIGVQNEVIKETQAANLKTAKLQSQVEKAQNDALQRQKTLQANIVSLNATNSSLRDTIASINTNLSSDSANALRGYIIAANAVIEASTTRYSSVAGKLDQCTSDLKTLSDAFPK